MSVKRGYVFFSVLLKDTISIPYVRMTRSSKSKDPKAIRYEIEKQSLAWKLRQNRFPKIPSDYFPIKVSCVIGLRRGNHRRLSGDADNHRKFILDAMVCAGMLPDDCLRFVCGSDHDRVVLSKHDFIWICLTQKRGGNA